MARTNATMQERLSVFVAKSPARAILLGIALFNVAFFLIAAAIIAVCIPESVEGRGYGAAVFYVISMVLDAGCVQYVIDSADRASAFSVVLCVVFIIIGMISFTGAVIGYITTRISSFIDHANTGSRPLKVSNHTIILNWNARASEIVNEMLYSEERETVVVLVEDGADEVRREIAERLDETIAREAELLQEACSHMSPAEARRYRRTHRIRNEVAYIVRQGNTVSTKNLMDISLSKAKAVIILNADRSNALCKYGVAEQLEESDLGNVEVVKELIQVSDITAAEDSLDNQVVVVEVNDQWTASLVSKVVSHKVRTQGKCSIVAVPANMFLGRILAQFAMMPELNQVYTELFSSRGAFFSSRKLSSDASISAEIDLLQGYYASHAHAVPLTLMESEGDLHSYYLTSREKDVENRDQVERAAVPMVLNPTFKFKKKNVLILGCNSELAYLMEGFDAYLDEWGFGNDSEVLDVALVYEPEYDTVAQRFASRSYVSNTVAADLYDKDTIYRSIEGYLAAHHGEVSIMLLSSDRVASKEIDANLLTHLVYIQDILHEKELNDPDFSSVDIDIIAEILDPKNLDVVASYNVNNVVISSRYISKIVTQISKKRAIYDFYVDILSYDSGDNEYSSKELYIKNASDLFIELPQPCTADVLIRSVYEQGLTLSDSYVNQTLLLGYVRDDDLTLFVGDQRKMNVELRPTDKLVVFSNH